jgi:predicted acylesterase/phospholipase RssA
LEPGAIDRISQLFRVLAGGVATRLRQQRSRPEGGWREWNDDARVDPRVPADDAAFRWTVLREDGEPSDWRALWEVQPGRWTVSVTGPTEAEAESVVESIAREMAAERADCIALSFSGGGFRATLFHLGFVRLLADAGLLNGVTHICSVSGGSILAAHLVQNWERYTSGQFDAAAQEIVNFASRDVRGRVFRRWIMATVLSPVLMLVGGLHRWNRTRLLQAEYDTLFRGEPLGALQGATRPELFLMATAMKTGDMCAFTANGLQFERRYLDDDLDDAGEQRIDCRLVPISLAVTASSAFPPAFPPVYVTHEQLRVDASQFLQSPEYLSDGGVYDNLGIRKIQNLRARTRFDLAAIIVSDAESPFVWKVGANYKRFWHRAVRASDILMRRVAELEYEWARRSAEDGRPQLLRVHISRWLADAVGALARELVHSVRQIRTDLDRFDPLEISCLVRHGYLVARQSLLESSLLKAEERRRIEQLATPWDPTEPSRSAEPTFKAPTSQAAKLEQVQATVERLEGIQRSMTRWTAAVFDARDWCSWVTLAALVSYLVMALSFPALVVFLRSSRELQRLRTDYGRQRAELKAELDTTANRLSGLERNTQSITASFNERWSFQITYYGVERLAAEVEPEVKQLAAQMDSAIPDEDSALRARVEAYRRLLKVAGKRSMVAAAYLRWAPVLGQEGQSLLRGQVREFVFPGGRPDQTVLLEFSGQSEDRDDRPAAIKLDFSQSRLSEPVDGGSPAVAVYSIDFLRVSEEKEYRGDLMHPLLRDNAGFALPIAEVRLWNAAPSQ